METIIQVKTQCPICVEDCFAAANRGYCPECNITFPLPKPSRKELMSVFLLKYYISKNSGFYHRQGCKYIKNISTENLVAVTEPVGKPCRCVQ